MLTQTTNHQIIMKNTTINFNDTIQAYLAGVAEQYDSGNECEAFVSRHGISFRPAALPPSILSGPAKECYHNAAKLAFSRSDLIYVEGFARWHGGPPFPFDHAWCCDLAGNVVDPTWGKAPGTEYFGVAFQTSFVQGFTVQTGVWGLIDRNHLDQLLAFPISRWRHPFHNQQPVNTL